MREDTRRKIAGTSEQLYAGIRGDQPRAKAFRTTLEIASRQSAKLVKKV